MAKNNNNNKQKERLIHELDVNIDKVQDTLAAFREAIDKIQNGDGETSYWNGSNACSIIKTALTQYEVDVSLLSHIKECKEAIKK